MSAQALVVGAGPAGLHAAYCLSGWCDHVTVIDQSGRHELNQVGEHLPPSGIAAIAQAGLGEVLDDPRHLQSHGIASTWGSDEKAERNYLFSPGGQGLNLDRSEFTGHLIRRAEKRGVGFEFDTRLSGLSLVGGTYLAEARNGKESTTNRFDLVVDASGRAVRAARFLGGTIAYSDPMACIIGRLEACKSEGGRLRIQAVENGWWYDAPLADGTVVCAFMTQADLIRADAQSPDEFWRAELSKREDFRRDAMTWNGNTHVCNAGVQCLSLPTLPGFVATGDAAAAFDPLSSWGIAKAIVDGAAAAEALSKEHLGDPNALSHRQETLNQNFQMHLIQRAQYYATEKRWPKALFWQNRHAACLNALQEG